MAIKIIIVVLFIGVLLSLSSGLYFLLKDFGSTESQRLRVALGVRVVLAAALLGSVYYGISSGQLSNQAPWDKRLHQQNNAGAGHN
ncbi:DUF2909 domain-containing protein [uncultured Pseudoteredinibacter sp.]|uniref:DUF2909 domain-containing protein n=1 Tax=uncultured Pseudoteredinibacter sp. TaxID=1641701 RepID=UPI002632472E|nr:DUF2909 domain-containing protein [uncultured Pseudoteredinibacter sp.]